MATNSFFDDGVNKPPEDNFTGNALKYLRVNEGETAYEYLTAAEVLSSLGLFTRNNQWDGANAFSQSVEAAGLTIGGVDLFARANTWTAEQTFQKVNAAEYEVGGAPLPMQNAYESGPIDLVPAAQSILAHGLGKEPKVVTLLLECVTAERNYDVGDRVLVQPILGGTGGNFSHSFVLDATNITLCLGSRTTGLFILGDKGTGDTFEITDANWKLYIKAYA